MSANAVVAGTYADFKVIKSRSVVQVVIELPIEKGADFIDKFGMPLPGVETWMAIAWLLKEPAPAIADPTPSVVKPVRNSPKGYRERAMQVSGLLPTYLPFQRYIAGHDPSRKGPVDDMPEPERIEKATALLRSHLGVQSRKELAGSDVLCAALYRLADDYDVACGRKVA